MVCKRAIILHGLKGYPEENWFPWLKNALEHQSYITDVPHLITSPDERYRSWHDQLLNTIGGFCEYDLVIGHSLGSAFALRLLEESNSNIFGLFLVSGFSRPIDFPPYNEMIQSFVLHTFPWDSILKKVDVKFIYHSDNDPIVPLKLGLELGELMKTPVKLIPGAGHFNTESGYCRFEQLFIDIRSSISCRLS
jgi:uncharacterized protein